MKKMDYPLSFAQTRLFLLNEMFPDSDAYNANLVFKLDGLLDSSSLEKALLFLIERHAILRTTFYKDDHGKCWQKIHQKIKFKLVLNKAFNFLNECALLSSIKSIIKKPFDLEHGPLIRAYVFQKNEQEYILILSFHHILIDGWSIKILIDELSDLYNKFRSKVEVENIPPALQFCDYALSQQDNHSALSFTKNLEYWLRHLKGIPDIHQFPLDKPRPKFLNFKGDCYKISTSVETLKNIKAISKENRCTLFMFLLAAFNVILYRYCGEEDLVIGSPVANRSGSEYSVIGFFVNLIVLRTSLNKEDTFESFLGKTKNICINAFRHQETPFDYLVDSLKKSRDLNSHPVFQILFDLQNSGDDTCPSFSNIKSEIYPAPDLVSKFDLTLSVRESSDRLEMVFEYATDLFNRDTIVRLAHNFLTLLENIILDPKRSISCLSVLALEENKTVVYDWNRTYKEFNRSDLVHDFFERCCARNPNNIAVMYEDIAFPYKQLNHRVNQIANYLINTYSVIPQMFIAVSVKPSINLVASFLSILKIGCVYVPIDPNYPSERISLIISEINPSVLITESKLIDNLVFDENKILFIDTASAEIERESIVTPNALIHPNFLAYMIFTSGSTGTPKGVMIEHCSLVERLNWLENQYPLDSDDSIINHASSSFDVAIEEILWPLSVGSKLVIAPSNSSRNIDEFINLVYKKKVTVIEFVPSLLSVFLSYAERDKLKYIKFVFVGGEILKPETLQMFYDKTNARLFNTYGATEATIDSTFFDCSQYDPDIYPNSIPVGKPRANTKIYILNDSLMPVPMGVIGEIYIGGISVARGYLNKSSLNEEKFLINPFENLDGEREIIYKTGDLGCFLPDGNLSFSGRTDDQVKLRGYRVEPGEIESSIASFSEVAYVAVIVREDLLGDHKLVAYLVLDEKNKSNLSKNKFLKLLKKQLCTTLPSYMLPSFIVFLQQVPLTDNGKLDRKNLPLPTLDDRLSIRDYVAPTTVTQKNLIKLWADVLGINEINRIGIEDNFFESGGNSLLAMRLVAKFLSEFAVKLPMNIVFESPNIANLALVIEEKISNKNSSLAVFQIKKSGLLYSSLSYYQQQLWIIQNLVADKGLYNVPAHYCLHGRIDIEKLEYAFNKIIDRHSILRTSIKLDDTIPIQFISNKPAFTIEKLDLSSFFSHKQQELLAKYINEYTFNGFNFTHDYLLRAAILKINDLEHVLLITFHHIICDEFSIAFFENELSIIYNSSSFEEISLPELPVQYIDFCLWQREFLNSKHLERHIAYWSEQLTNIPETSTFPLDKSRDSEFTYRGNTQFYVLSKHAKDSLLELAEFYNTTLFVILFSALATLMFLYTSQNDLVIGTPFANRDDPYLENLIGYLVNVLALRVQVKRNMRFSKMIEQVSKTISNAFSYHALPFEKLVGMLKKDRSLIYNPIFQVMIAMEKIDVNSINLSGIDAKSIKPKNIFSKFDLTLWVQEGYEGEEGLRLGFEYATDLFNASTIERLGNHFINLLEEVVAYPEKEIGTYKIMSSKEEARLLSEWNGATVRYSEKNSVIELIEEQVKKTPELIALGYREEALSYSELSSRANKLAHYLTGLGIRSGDMVGVCLNRGIDLIVTLLATMKIGGVYVPLDPNYPEQRLNYIMQDCGGKWLLTESKHREIFKTFSHDIVCIDEISMDSMSNSRDISCTKKASDLAYVIYTSGSTGLPKGVMIEHRNVLNFLRSMQELLEITEKDVFIGLTSISFDISGLEMYLPLITGSKLVLIDKEIASDGNRLGGVIDEEGVSVVQGTPSNWQLLLSTGWKPKLALKILCGGEALSSSLAEKLLSIRDEIINLYGPTETTIWSGLSKVRNSEHISIGLPIANTRFYVLDENLKLVPPGVVGELHISGAGVGRGYLNKAELTEQRFISNPYEVGERLYKTGDLVKRLEDGGIVYIGRIDNQVKVRGFRIEIGEIEAVLNKFSGIKEAVVILRDDISKEKELVAYLVVNSEWLDIADEALSKEVLLYLRSQVPDYMLPSHFVKLERLPLTPNGKVDRKSLPKPDRETRLNTNEYVAPVTEVEQKLSEIWANVLGIEQVGLHDNFFDLGGNSILIVSMHAKLQHELEISFAITALFKYPSIALLAKYLLSTSKNIIQEQSVDDKKMKFQQDYFKKLRSNRSNQSTEKLH